MKIFKFSNLFIIAWSLMFTIAPLGILIFFSLTNSSSNFTIENFLQIKNYWQLILRSVVFSALTTLICLIIALPFAFYIYSSLKKSNQKLIIALITLPTWTNLLIRTFAWMTLIENNGLINKILKIFNLPKLQIINTPIAVILVMVYDFLPFMILPIYSAINKINKNILDASHDLGANEFQTFKQVVFPLSSKGIVQGISSVFMFSSSTFVIPRLMSGGTTILIGDLIESQFMGLIYNPWLGSALALGLNLFIIFMLTFTNKLTQSTQGASKHEAEIFL